MYFFLNKNDLKLFNYVYYNMNNNVNENISFFLKEKESDELSDDKYNIEKENELQKMIQELDEEINEDYIYDQTISSNGNKNIDLMYFVNKDFYNNDELYYNEEYSVKELLKICNYYGIDKNIRTSKCKKQDIISTIIYFESLSENYLIVQQRNLMWAYMTELFNDSKMKKYVIWN